MVNLLKYPVLFLMLLAGLLTASANCFQDHPAQTVHFEIKKSGKTHFEILAELTEVEEENRISVLACFESNPSWYQTGWHQVEFNLSERFKFTNEPYFLPLVGSSIHSVICVFRI